MKKAFSLFLALVMCLTLVACGSSVEKIDDFGQLDPAKFKGLINGDGYFLVLYEGDIDEAVAGATLAVVDGPSVTLTANNKKNPRGCSLLFFEDCKVALGDTVQLTLSKEGYETISFTVVVE